MLSVALAITVAGVDQKRAEELVESADKICPYTNVDVAPNSGGYAACFENALLHISRDGEKRLWVSCISFTAKLAGQGQLHIKQPVFAADVAMTAASCGNFSGIQSLYDSIRIGR